MDSEAVNVITVAGSQDFVAAVLDGVGITIADGLDMPADVGSVVAELGYGVAHITWQVRGTK